MSDLRASVKGQGPRLMGQVEAMYPICRSITGEGVRQTLDLVRQHVPIAVHQVASGTQVLDWVVPDEWNVRDAYVADESGARVIDFAASNLHVVNYSEPVDVTLSLDELRPHLHTLPDHPDWIPYRTTYYQRTWGFCLRSRDLETWPEGTYRAVIDATLEPGHLTYGELLLPGRVEDEILISTHVCHPSMANDNLSGIAVLTALAEGLAQLDRHYSYRILFMPGTIGAITWLATHRDDVARIRHGLVIAGLGDRGPLCYKQTRRGDTALDRTVARVLSDREHRWLPFSPYGYDERQFGSPGFDLEVGRLSRSEYATYPEYHTSADDLSFVNADSLQDSLLALAEIVEALDARRPLRSTAPYGEPQLGKRGLYDNVDAATRLAYLWVLNLADGHHTEADVVEQSGLDATAVAAAVRALTAAGLLHSTP